MSLCLPSVTRFLYDKNGELLRDSRGRPILDPFLDPFGDEIINLTLFMLANRNWTGNRFEAELIGTPLFFRRIKNKASNGWTGSFGTGMEIGRSDKSWKILVAGFDSNRVSAAIAQDVLDKGWKNLTPADGDLFTSERYGHVYGLGGIPKATDIRGDDDIFAKDMMMVRMYMP